MQHLVVLREEEGQGRGDEGEDGNLIQYQYPSHYEHIASPHFAKTQAPKAD